MGIIAFGPEGELIANDVTLNTSLANSEHRGHEVFDQTQYSLVDLGAMPYMWFRGKGVILGNVLTLTNGGQHEFFCIKDAANNILCSVRGVRDTHPGYHYLRVYSVNDDTTGLAIQFYGSKPTTYVEVTYDLEVRMTGTTLYFAFYRDGSKLVEKAIVGAVPAWGEPAKIAFGGYCPRGDTMWRDIIVSDTPIMGTAISTLRATGAGSHNDASGDYDDISEVGVNLSTTMSFATIGDKESWVVEGLVGKVFDSTSINGILLSFLASLTNPAINGLRPFVRSGGVDYPVPDTLVPDAVHSNITYHMQVNPATGAQFTPAEIDAGIEVGLEAV